MELRSDFELSRPKVAQIGGGSKGGPPALAGTREYEQSESNKELWSYVVKC